MPMPTFISSNFDGLVPRRLPEMLPCRCFMSKQIFYKLKGDSMTRGHKAELVKPYCRLDKRKVSFSQRTINDWNHLSYDCVNARSVNMFKN